MNRKFLTLGGLFLIFAGGLGGIFAMQEKKTPAVVVPLVQKESETGNNQLYVYQAAELKEGCSSLDKVFCAVERAVKCTIKPELVDCAKGKVPGFVLGQAGGTARPSVISFEITKLKPLANENSLSVYTRSECDAEWFGLCRGTVIYSLKPDLEAEGEWVVENVYALE